MLAATLAGLALVAGLTGCAPPGPSAQSSGGGPCVAPATWEDGRPLTEAEARWVNTTCQRSWFLDQLHRQPFLVCTRSHESDTNGGDDGGLHDGGYGAISAGGTYRGAYQFLQSTWNAAVDRMHAAEPGGLWGFLIGQDPATVGVAEQDSVAWSYSDGGRNTGPWGGRCSGMAA